MTDGAFILSPPPQTQFGAGVVGEAHRSVPETVTSVLIVADPAMTEFGFVAPLVESLAGRKVTLFDDIVSDPTEAQVEAGRDALNAANAQLVIAIGGGSALDAGKAIAALAQAPGPVADYRLAETAMPKRRIGLIGIPSTAGTGAEATRTAILSTPDHVKNWFWGDALAYDTVFLDPALTVTLPAHLTAATGADALVHAIEAATNASASPASRLYAHEAIRLVATHLEAAIARPDDLTARGALLWASFLGGSAINQAGTALAHCFGHAIGSLASVHHGRAVAIAMNAGADMVARANPAPFAEVAKAMGAAPDHTGFAPAFAGLMARIGLDLTLPPGSNLSADMLVKAAMEPANSAMWQVTIGDFGRQELGIVAERIAVSSPVFV